MNRDDILNCLRKNEPALRERGVQHAALFGSHARADAQSSSDIDILVEIAPQVNMDLFGYSGLIQYLEDLFPLRVDVANRDHLKAHVRPSSERDAIYAF